MHTDCRSCLLLSNRALNKSSSLRPSIFVVSNGIFPMSQSEQDSCMLRLTPSSENSDIILSRFGDKKNAAAYRDLREFSDFTRWGTDGIMQSVQ